MKIAHFAIFAPHASGQYGTVKDLILAERDSGIDAQFIDFGRDKNTSREGLVDGLIRTAPLDWALNNADVVIRHTSVPSEVYAKKPVVLALHGRPENSFRLEQYDIHPIISSIRNAANDGKHSAIFTFWEDYKFYWRWITGGVKIHYVPSLVNFREYKPEGPKHDFGQFKAKINIVIADMWREDNIPFNLIFAAQYFKERYYPDTRVHLFGVPIKKKCFSFLSSLQKRGVVGQVGGVIGGLADVYRAADILLTPNIIATRIIRESMASGLPIVAPIGCKYTPYTAEPRDYKDFARMIKECYEFTTLESKSKLRQDAQRFFDNRKSAQAVRNICEGVLGKPKWNGMSITESDWEALKDAVEKYKIKNVVEFGAGISTELLGSLGLGVVSFETIPDWAKAVKDKVPSADIRTWNGKNSVSLNGADMALIDGPHKSIGRDAAYASVFNSRIPIVACHDIHREEERRLVKTYFGDCQELARTEHLVILRRENAQQQDGIRISSPPG